MKDKNAPILGLDDEDVPFSYDLTEDDKAVIREEARRGATKERKDQLKKMLMEQYLREERCKLDPEQEEVLLNIELPPFADRIMLDGVIFMHGREYPMSRRKANSINEVMEMAWRHDDVAFGRRAAGERRRDAGRHTSGIALTPHGAVTTAGSFLRV